jgi:hypothetical protein
VLLNEDALTFGANDQDPDIANISRYRRVLEPGLLVPALGPGFDAVEKYVAWTELSKNLPAPADPGAAVFKFFTISLTIGDQSDDSGGKYRANAVLTNGTKVKLLRLDGSGSTELQHDGDLQHQHATDVFYGQVEPGKPPVTWNGLARLEVIVEIAQRSNANEENISFTHSHISAQQENGIVADVQDSILDWRTNNITPQTIALTTNRPPAAPTVPTPEQRLADEENLLRLRLQYHLNHNQQYYDRLIRLNEDPNARIDRIGDRTINIGGATMPLLQAIQNRALDVYGHATAFPLDPALFDHPGNGDPMTSSSGAGT